jgi:hypothetical protein
MSDKAKKAQLIRIGGLVVAGTIAAAATAIVILLAIRRPKVATVPVFESEDSTVVGSCPTAFIDELPIYTYTIRKTIDSEPHVTGMKVHRKVDSSVWQLYIIKEQGAPELLEFTTVTDTSATDVAFLNSDTLVTVTKASDGTVQLVKENVDEDGVPVSGTRKELQFAKDPKVDYFC